MNKIKAIRVYQTSDGKTHETMQQATKHEALQKLFTNVKGIIEKSSKGGYGTTHIDLINNPSLAREMRDMMNKVLDYHRIHTGKITVNKKS